MRRTSPSREGHARERARTGVVGLWLTCGTLASGLGACTDGRARERVEPTAATVATVATTVAGVVPRNSDGSPQVLPPGPPSRPPHTLVLAYADFGPQALAGELLGSEWWQWEAGGSWEPGDAFDVRVVVYRGPTRAEVEAEYPTVVGQADYRYVSYDEAIAFLDRALAELAGDPSLARLHGELFATRARLRESLAAPLDRPPS